MSESQSAAPLPRRAAPLLWIPIISILFLLTTSSAAAQVYDQYDSWAAVDILWLDAAVAEGNLGIGVQVRDPLINYYDDGWPVLELFLDTDQDPSTGDYRRGAAAGSEYMIQCLGDFVACTLYTLPRVAGEQTTSTLLNYIEGAVVYLPNSTSLYVQLPTQVLDGAQDVDVFAMGWFRGNNASLSHTLLFGNGDRVPDAGAIESATGDLVVRRAVPPIDVSMAVQSDDSFAANEIVGARLRTFGDQFELALELEDTIDPASWAALRGGVVIDSDRRLKTGQVPMTPPHGLGDQIPSWGGDVQLSFWMDDQQTQLAFQLQYEAPEYPVAFGSGCAQDTHLAGLAPCNDGRWRIDGNRLIFAGSLSMLDAEEYVIDIASSTSQRTRHPSDGRLITRFFTIDEATGAEDPVPAAGRAWDTGSTTIRDPLEWDTALMQSDADPEEYFGSPGIDLIRVDAQVQSEKLVIKGVLALWLQFDPNVFFEVLLDTDDDTTTGEYVQNVLSGQDAAIGADYKLIAYVVYDGLSLYFVTDLRRPDGKFERHDAFLLAQPSTLDDSSREASFTLTVPLESLDGPEAVSLFVATRRYDLIVSERYDIAPPSPIRLDASGGGDNGRIVVQPGMNLFTMRWEVPDEYRSCYRLFEALGGSATLDALKRFDPVHQVWESCDGEGGTDFSVNAGEAYLVYAQSSASLELSTNAVTPDVTLEPGVNLIGFPCRTEGVSCYDWLRQLGPDSVSAIRRYESRTGRFGSCGFTSSTESDEPYGIDFPIDWEDAYFVDAHGPTAVGTCSIW